MFFTVVISVLGTLYVLCSFGLYLFHYVIEEVLDLPLTGQSPNAAHVALKQLITNLLKEAVTLPQLEKPETRPNEEEHSANRSYEDLLATAIINKVVTNCQNNFSTSSIHSGGSNRISSASRTRPGDSKEYFFGEETLDSKWKTTDIDTTSVSSLEEWITRSESSLGSKKYVDRFTLTIKQNIEDADAFDTDNEEEENDFEYFRTNSSLLNYNESEENWFLQRRNFHGTPSPVPVPMLVPNPTTEAKVLIGDKPVDDTSDLSDIGSEDYDYQPELPLSTHTLLVESKSLIGGRSHMSLLDDPSELNNGEEYEQSESSTDSGVKEVNGKDATRYTRMGRNEKLEHENMQSKAAISVDDDNVEDLSYMSINSHTEKEAEYIEKYGSLPRTIIKTPTAPSRPSRQIDKRNKESAVLDEENPCDFEKEFVGNYSKKEKEKWNHAIEMKNNPYSKENIEKRIKRPSSYVSSLFGPDYYARQAKSPSGDKNKTTEVNGVSWPPKQLNVNDELEYKKHVKGSGVYKAVYADISTQNECKNGVNENHNQPDHGHFQVSTTEEKLVTKQKTVHHNYQNNSTTRNDRDVTTSDSDLSYINFYDVEHAQVIMKTKNEDIKIPIKQTSLQGTFKPLSDENGNDQQEIDKNNDVLEEKVKPVIKSTPAVKPRMTESRPDRFFKKSTVPTKKSFKNISAANPHILKRHLSESDLLDDSLPNVVYPKTDNTLIEKINKGHTPNQLAISYEYNLNPQSMASKPSQELNKKSIYHSFDDLSSEHEYSSGKTGKMSFFSSEEDLLSINSDAGYSKLDYPVERRPLSRESYISGSSSTYTPTPKPLSTRKFIYSSLDDLLSNSEEMEVRPRKKDNTLISKIYKDPNVRKTALNSRDFIPTTQNLTTRPRMTSQYSSDDEQLSPRDPPLIKKSTHPLTAKSKSIDNLKHVVSEVSETQIRVLNEIEEQKQLVRNHSEDEESESQKIRRKHNKSRELQDVEEVAMKKLVINILEKFSEPEDRALTRTISVDDLDHIKISVKDLRRKFENTDGKTKHVVSSLTARSLSKQMKKSLKE